MVSYGPANSLNSVVPLVLMMVFEIPLTFMPSLQLISTSGFKLELLTKEISAPVSIKNFSSFVLLRSTPKVMVSKFDL